MRWAKWRVKGGESGSREWTSFPDQTFAGKNGLGNLSMLKIQNGWGGSALFLGEVQKVLFEMVSYLGKAVLSHVNMPFLEQHILEEQLKNTSTPSRTLTSKKQL